MGNLNVTNNLTNIGKSLFFSDVDIYGQLNMKDNSNVNNITVLSKLIVNDTARFNNDILCSIIKPIANSIIIDANTITIGNAGSIINILGSTSYIETSQLVVTDKLITLNINKDSTTAFDTGSLSGIEILGTGQNGFIKTTEDASRYYIKAPNNTNTEYITTFDINNNLSIPGNSIIYKSLTVLSTLLVNSNATFLSNLNIMSDANINSLNVVNTSTLNGNTIINGTLSCYNNITATNNLSVLNNSSLNDVKTNNLTVISKLYSNIVNIASCDISGLRANNSTIDNLTVTSNLYVLSKTILNNSVTFMSNINVSGISIFNNDTTFQKNVTTMSPITIMNTSNFLSTILFSNIPEYSSNLTATEHGVPLWGLYRTGGIIKIRLDEILPVLTLLPFNGNINITINQYVPYREPGVTAFDNLDGVMIANITSIYSVDVGELILTPVPVMSENYLLSTISTSLPRVYTIIYSITDSSGNYVNKSRVVTIRDLIRTLLYNNTNISQYAIAGGNRGSIYSSNLIDGIKNAWCINQIALTSLDFKFDVAWKIILKIQLTSLSAPVIEFCFDSALNTIGKHSGRYNVQFGNFHGSTFAFNYINTEITDEFSIPSNFFSKMQTGMYIEMVYDLTNITINFLDLAGVNVYSWVSPTAITFTNNFTPFNIYGDVDGLNYYNGIFYNILSPYKLATYLDFKSRFGIL